MLTELVQVHLAIVEHPEQALRTRHPQTLCERGRGSPPESGREGNSGADPSDEYLKTHRLRFKQRRYVHLLAVSFSFARSANRYAVRASNSSSLIRARENDGMTPNPFRT